MLNCVIKHNDTSPFKIQIRLNENIVQSFCCNSMNNIQNYTSCTPKTADLMYKYGSDICKMIQAESADAMEMTLLLVLHLCIINDLERGNTECDWAILRRLAQIGGPIFLKTPYRSEFFNRLAVMERFKWTKKEYGLVRVGFDRNVNKWNLLLRSLRVAKLI